MAFVAVVAYCLDQGTKLLVTRTLVEGDSVDVLGEFFQLHFVKNPGAAFSFASGATWIFSIAATGVAVAIVVVSRRIRSRAWAIMLGMLLGGTLGNLTDRLLREPSFGQGHVVDFIYFPSLLPAIFNVADVFIVSSMGLLLLLTLLGIGLDGTRTPSAKKTRTTEEDDPMPPPRADSRADDGRPAPTADTAPPADHQGAS
ncbi:signal peptidase II [Frigoribacterium sp. VKM Ac-2836]|nr:signal peptidase II [Frigoribacterium sp. VKM Ac-2836]